MTDRDFLSEFKFLRTQIDPTRSIADVEYQTERLETCIGQMIAKGAGHDELLAWFEKAYAQAWRDYNDWLSLE